MAGSHETFWFRGTPVEKHWPRPFSSMPSSVSSLGLGEILKNIEGPSQLLIIIYCDE